MGWFAGAGSDFGGPMEPIGLQLSGTPAPQSRLKPGVTIIYGNALLAESLSSTNSASTR